VIDVSETPDFAAPRRTPFHDVNVPLSTMNATSYLQVYSPVTPVFTYPTHQPREKKNSGVAEKYCRRRKSCTTFTRENCDGGKHTTEAILSDEVMINAVVLEKAKRIADQQVRQVGEIRPYQWVVYVGGKGGWVSRRGGWVSRSRGWVSTELLLVGVIIWYKLKSI